MFVINHLKVSLGIMKIARTISQMTFTSTSISCEEIQILIRTVLKVKVYFSSTLRNDATFYCCLNRFPLRVILLPDILIKTTA